jgi:hypothetical protein
MTYQYVRREFPVPGKNREFRRRNREFLPRNRKFARRTFRKTYGAPRRILKDSSIPTQCQDIIPVLLRHPCPGTDARLAAPGARPGSLSGGTRHLFTVTYLLKINSVGYIRSNRRSIRLIWSGAEMTVIAMTREMGSPGTDVAAGIASELGLTVIHSEFMPSGATWTARRR